MNEHNEHEDGLLLSCYLDGQLDAAETARVKAHLAGCSLCRSEVDSLSYMKRVLADSPRRAMPPELIGAIEDRIGGNALARGLWERARAPRVFVPAGALAALALTAALWLGFKTESPEQAIPLEPLLAAHARYTAETLVPQGSLVSSIYSAQLTASSDAPDQDVD